MEYVLVQWPDVQYLMNYDWFDTECHLLNPLEDQENYDSAYFVPKQRIEEHNKEMEFLLRLLDAYHRRKNEL